MNKSFKSFAVLSVWALVQFSGQALAQEAPLSGPAVKDDSVPGGNRKLSGGSKDRRDRMAPELPHRVFVQAFGVIQGEKADQAMRTTSEQDAQLKAIGSQLRDAQRKYIEDNKQEIESIKAEGGPELRRRIDMMLGGRPGPGEGPGPGRGKGNKGPKAPPANDAMSDAPAAGDENSRPNEAIRNKAKALMEGAPNATEYHAKMWSVLTATQKPVVEKELARLREQMASKRGKGPGGPKGKGDGAGPMDPTNFDESKLPEKARERLKGMTPEQKEEAIKRFMERKGNK